MHRALKDVPSSSGPKASKAVLVSEKRWATKWSDFNDSSKNPISCFQSKSVSMAMF